MALLGPEGFRQLGETIMAKANYAIKLLSEINRVEVPVFKASHFKEFTVNYDAAHLSVEEVNKSLLQDSICGICGGKDISKEFPELGQTALYCVTEIHSKEDIERLVEALKAVLDEG